MKTLIGLLIVSVPSFYAFGPLGEVQADEVASHFHTSHDTVPDFSRQHFAAVRSSATRKPPALCSEAV